ncbi:Ctf8-domain-containing protein [Corynascus novoguineensis]|uniref:Ctf8-domain-containing protein n=1 Tax=Corynascus novoguineensis TaxID=1126955 RepID=A0AAN7CY88_9PEZI|nr:Ctf8-domain-containing protein [Corynascus novoguineensis]
MSIPAQAIPLHPRPLNSTTSHNTTPLPSPQNPLPPLLQTPSGLALLELQGTINLPPFPPDTAPTSPAFGAAAKASSSPSSALPTIPIGRLHFPDYDGSTSGDSTVWTKRVWMYVGEHQRLHGEVKKLPRAIAVLRRRRGALKLGDDRDQEGTSTEELEVVEIVKWKVVFSSRPEPVGAAVGS